MNEDHSIITEDTLCNEITVRISPEDQKKLLNTVREKREIMLSYQNKIKQIKLSLRGVEAMIPGIGFIKSC